jgi:hypothetical protein
MAKNLFTTKLFPLANPKSGIISFQVPADAPALELDKNYRWWISISALDIPPGQNYRAIFVELNLPPN